LAAPLLGRRPDSFNDEERTRVRDLALALGRLGDIRRERGNPRCLEDYDESIQLYRHIADKSGEAARCFNLGHAYKNVDAIRDLEESERWYRRSLELRPAHDNLSRAQCFAQLGALALRRLEEAAQSGSSGLELDTQFATAIDFYSQALAATPPEAVDSLAAIHNQLGAVYSHSANHLDLAVEQLREAIWCYEVAGDRYMAGAVRSNLAWSLLHATRFADARDYALSAISILEACPIPAAELIRSAQSCLRAAEEALTDEACPPG
jgi:tetratricopeptide (TPR) repeat protein